MKKLMIPILLLALLMFGCCENPGVFQQVGQTVNAINTAAQPFYGPAAEGSTEAQMAIAAATMAPILANSIQEQWCPPPTSDPRVQALNETAKALSASKKELTKKGLIK